MELHELDDARKLLEENGFTVLPPDSPRQYGVAWDGRVIMMTEKRERAEAVATEQNAAQTGDWTAVQRIVADWGPLTDEVTPTGERFWQAQGGQ